MAPTFVAASITFRLTTGMVENDASVGFCDPKQKKSAFLRLRRSIIPIRSECFGNAVIHDVAVISPISLHSPFKIMNYRDSLPMT
jgi:hypothetical protein